MSVTRKLGTILAAGTLAASLTACGGGESGADDNVVRQEAPKSSSAEESALPDEPQSYSTLTIMGDQKALPEGDAGEVSIVAISEPDGGTSFPFILYNGTDQPVSRVEVSGRAQDADGTTLGSGTSQSIEPNVILPDAYAIGYVYIDSSRYELPPGSSIPDLRISYEDGLGEFENIITLDVENVEELQNGDLVGDVSNPHDIAVTGPISVATACYTPDGEVLESNDFTDGDMIAPDDLVTWTISSYGTGREDCAVRLVGASGFE